MKSYVTCRPLSTLNEGEKYTKLLQLHLLPLVTNYYLYKKIAFFRVGCIYLFSLYLFPVMVLAQASAHQAFCPEVVFKNLQESPGIDSKESIPSTCSPAGRYDNPIPTRFLAPINCSKIPAQPIASL
jgi:hypothetical protein